MLRQSWKKVYSRTTTFGCCSWVHLNTSWILEYTWILLEYTIPLLQAEHGFCQQNGPEGGQLQDWYPDDKMMVVPGCLSIINKDEDDESLSFLVFWRHIVSAICLKYSKEGRLSSSHVGIRIIPLDVCYDDTKHWQMQS